MKRPTLLLLSTFTIMTAITLGVVLLKHFSSDPVASSAQPLPAGGDFILHSFKEKNVSLDHFRGKVVLLYFGYTSCPDICPTSLASISEALMKLPKEQLKNVQVIFVSVDPDRDSKEKLSNYTRYFNKKIIGVTGTRVEIDKVASQYGVEYKKVKSNSAMGYLIDHSASIYVINPRGKLVKMLPHGISPEKIYQTIQTLLP